MANLKQYTHPLLWLTCLELLNNGQMLSIKYNIDLIIILLKMHLQRADTFKLRSITTKKVKKYIAVDVNLIEIQNSNS